MDLRRKLALPLLLTSLAVGHITRPTETVSLDVKLQGAPFKQDFFEQEAFPYIPLKPYETKAQAYDFCPDYSTLTLGGLGLALLAGRRKTTKDD